MSTSYMIDECFSGLLMLNGFCLVFTSLILNLFFTCSLLVGQQERYPPCKKNPSAILFWRPLGT